jgi:hypothetical protein
MSPRFQNPGSEPAKSVQRKDSYDLAFIEFGEQGSYLDTSQVEAAFNLVRYSQKPLVITYVHGWHNDSGSNDVDRFCKFLSQIAATPLIKTQGFHVIGVYLGWRGEITKVPILTEFTFFSRKTAAERLASNFDCFDAISSVAEAARGHHQSANQYTILLGHSFGGLVVERAVAHAVDAKMHGRSAKGSSLPADLTLVLNPASDSILSRQILSALYQKKTENTRPIFVSVTSTADDATGKIFPIATTLASISKAFPQVGNPGSTKNENERHFYTSTPGHNAALINHEARIVNMAFNPRPGLSALEMNLSNNLGGDTVVLPAKNGGFELWKLWRTSSIDVPYWDIQVDERIIENHGDIWNDRVEALMAGIFRIANPLRPDKGRREATFEQRRSFRRAQYKQPSAEVAFPRDLR